MLLQGAEPEGEVEREGTAQNRVTVQEAIELVALQQKTGMWAYAV